MFGNKLTLLEAVLMTITLAVLMVLAAKSWGWVKSKYPIVARWIVLTLVIAGGVLFLFF
jgi:hypothetical protein